MSTNRHNTCNRVKHVPIVFGNPSKLHSNSISLVDPVAQILSHLPLRHISTIPWAFETRFRLSSEENWISLFIHSNVWSNGT